MKDLSKKKLNNMNHTLEHLINYIEQTNPRILEIEEQCLINDEINDQIMEECLSIIKQSFS